MYTADAYMEDEYYEKMNRITALVVAGIISCTSPMMVMASDSGSIMSQMEEVLKNNEVESLAADPDKVSDIIVYVKGLLIPIRLQTMRYHRESMRQQIIMVYHFLMMIRIRW